MSAVDIDKLYEETKKRLSESETLASDRYDTYDAYVAKDESLGKLYQSDESDILDLYVTYKLNPDDKDTYRKYQVLTAALNGTLKKVTALGASIGKTTDQMTQTLSLDSNEIQILQTMYQRLSTMRRRISGVDSTSEQQVYDYGTIYSMRRTFYWIQIAVLVICAIYFIGTQGNRLHNIGIFIAAVLLYYVVIIIIIVITNKTQNLPDGPGKVTTSTSSFTDMVQTFTDGCFEDACCADGTSWESGTGCVVDCAEGTSWVDGDGCVDDTETFTTYASMCRR